jgi:hypothetical protein
MGKRWPAWLLGLLLAVPSCASHVDRGIYQEADFQPPPDRDVIAFDPNNLMDTAQLSDTASFDATLIQAFFHQTPYDRPTFLETYQSNGVRASEAVARASRTYRIAPLIFLVAAQGTGGLIGEKTYPFPPERVEYVFRCGCLEGNDCLPELAGFDRQVDCLGRQLRVALDQIERQGATVGGWGPNRTSLSLDNVSVTPQNAATAAIYDRSPRVGVGAPGGTWFLWNLFHVYAASLSKLPF